MFCPNCGKDSGEFKFCPYCGTKIPDEEVKSEVWSVGMPCPHCGGTQLEGNNCAFCGARLIADVLQSKDEEWDSYEIPYRCFAVGIGSSLTLNKDEIVIETKSFLSSNKKRIPYSQINEAEYTRTEGYTGHITFRWGFGNTETVILSNEDKCFFYYQIFFVIKQLAPFGTRFKINCPPVDREKMDRFGKIVDLDKLFEKYAPCRELAAKELGAKCMLPPEEARAFVHAFFDMRLEQSYKADRRLAARDYNRMMRERNRQFEEWEAEREKRRIQKNRYH